MDLDQSFLNPDDQDPVEKLCEEARELPPEEREPFLFAATGDSDLRQRVLERLRQEAEMGSFMETLPVFRQEQKRDETPSQPTFPDGSLVDGRYRIERFIGVGGMGEVYKAHDCTLNKRVALKAIRLDIAFEQAAVARFCREVALAQEVNDPNVCRVFDFGTHATPGNPSGICFLTMEYLPGETVRERLLKSGPMTPQQALPIIRQMAKGLTAAHAVGVIHRDFKPANVILVSQSDGTERAVVSDFGLARSADINIAEQSLTASGQVLGTPQYMSPEQWSGRDAGPEADVFALGMTIREMTGDQTAYASWNSVIKQCLAHNPQDRPPSAMAVAEALEASLAPQPSRTRRRAIWLSVAALVIAVSLLGLLLRLLVHKEASAASQADRIVVLPPRVDNADLTSFADGLSGAVTSRLAQYSKADSPLPVLPASEIRRGQVESPSVARAKFGARYAVETAVQSQGDRLRLTMTLIDTESMQQKDSAFIDGRRSNALALQDAAVARIATMLKAEVQPKYASELNRMNPLDPGAYEFYLQAKGYLRRNDRPTDIDAAIEVARRALQLDPKYAPGHTVLAEAYWQQHARIAGDTEWVNLALRECRTALELDPNLAEAHTMMGTAYAGTGRRQQAVEEFLSALKIDPDSFEAHLGLGRVYVALKEFAKAEAPFRKAIELQRQDWHGYRELGMLYYHQSDYRKAAQMFEHVVDLVPDNVGAYTNLGAFYGLLNNPVKSEAALRKALQISPNAGGALTNLAKLMSEQGRYTEAAGYWERAVALDSSSYRIWGNLGFVYRKLNREADARRAYESGLKILNSAISVNPADENLISNRAHFLAALGRKKEAMADLARTGSLQGSEKEMLVRDAISFDELGEIPRARELLKKALDLGYPREEAMRNERLREVLQSMK